MIPGRNNLARRLMGLMLLGGLSACSTISKYYEANPILPGPQSLVKKDNPYLIDTGKLAERVVAIKKDKNKRNELLLEVIGLSERVCSRHQAAIISNANTWNVVTGTATNLLSAVGTVVGGESTKSAIAAGASFMGATRSIVNDQVYQQAVATTIVSAIDHSRKRFYQEIQQGFTADYQTYSVESGLRDIQEYHRRCSFYNGVLELTKSLENQKPTKSEIDKDIKHLKEQLAEVEDLKLKPEQVTLMKDKLSSRLTELLLRRSEL